MSTYRCSVSTAPGPAPEHGKAHHVKNQSGQLVRFENPFPSFGRWKDISLFRAGLIYLGCVSATAPLSRSSIALLYRALRIRVWPASPSLMLPPDRYKAQGKLPVPDTSDARIPTVPASFLPSRLVGGSLRTTWLGHASHFVEFPSGLRALFDPVFEERFNSLGPKRFTPAACGPRDFPALDAVFISHNHHDHLSHTTVKEIALAYPRVHFFVGLGLAQWFRDSGIHAVTEMDWWDDAQVTLQRETTSAHDAGPQSISARVSCLPSQHGSMRSPLDKDRSLWASWAVTSGGKSLWFAGDTAYRCVPEGIDELGPGFDQLPRNPHFSQIGELRGPFDLGLIPIGAYHPRFMYSPVHVSPYDAVEIFQDTKCRMALGIHWGTWALTSEPVQEPPHKLKEALKIKGLAQTGVFDVCAIGESRDF
ncbi:hypothetical protein CDD81_706 [Ophiocordyceps australis]|uniref:Metallo-beta-lactamase domain-containing protein n=1 Tax=Ophiocordyceps australis TaxID=1399860 RepID=A0A2C5Y0K2_9HYPO|nr:hypothetical protein CDD81_706 [Ophiocordyceps australis]